MALKAPQQSNNSDYKPQAALEPGTYPARIVRVLDLGLQPQQPYQGQEKKPAHVINVTYELVDVFMVDDEGNDLEDKPRWISEDFPLNSLSSDLAKSTKRSNAIDPKNEFEGDWSQYLGLPCLVTTRNYKKKDGSLGDGVSNVSAVRSKDAAKMEELKNPAVFFDLSNPDLEIFNKLPKWMQEKIQSNLEYAGSPLDRALNGKAAPKPAKKEEPKKEAPEAGEGEDEDEIPW